MRVSVCVCREREGGGERDRERRERKKIERKREIVLHNLKSNNVDSQSIRHMHTSVIAFVESHTTARTPSSPILQAWGYNDTKS